MKVSSEISGLLMVFPVDEANTLKEKLDALSLLKYIKPKL